MVPKVNNRGHSFKGITAYLLHDKGMADTDHRVAWSMTGNMFTNDIEKASKVMAWTDENAELIKQGYGGSTAGAKPEKGGVYHYSLSWAHGERPSEEHMKEHALETLKRLGLSEHQYYIVAHNDTYHAHVHVVANLTDHITGKRHTPSFDKKELQAWALEYERTHGMHCEMREKNAQKREQKEHIKHRDQKQDYSIKVTRAYYASDSGKSFIHALEAEGLTLAKGRRENTLVIVDERGDIQKFTRQLDIEEKGKAKTAAIKAFLSDINVQTLPDAEEKSRGIKEEIKKQLQAAKDAAKEQEEAQKAADRKNNEQDKQPEIFDRDQYETDQQNDLLDAAENYAKDQVAREKAERKLEVERERLALEREKEEKRSKFFEDAPEWIIRVNKIYDDAKDGLEFRRRLREEESITLAKGDRGQLVIVDHKGTIHSLVKNIEGQNYKQIEERLDNVNYDTLVDAETVKKIIHQELYSEQIHARARAVNHAREKWQIDHLKGELDNAREDVHAFGGSLKKVIYARQYRDLQEEEIAKAKTLNHAQIRLAQDINAIYKNASKEQKDEAFKEHGVTYQKDLGKPSEWQEKEAAEKIEKWSLEALIRSIKEGWIEQRSLEEQRKIDAAKELQKQLEIRTLKEKSTSQEQSGDSLQHFNHNRDARENEQEQEKVKEIPEFRQNLDSGFAQELGQDKEAFRREFEKWMEEKERRQELDQDRGLDL